MKNNEQYIAFDYLAIQPTIFSPFHGGGKYGMIMLYKLLSISSNVILFYSKKLPHAEIVNIVNRYKDVVLADLDKKYMESGFFFIQCFLFVFAHSFFSTL